MPLVLPLLVLLLVVLLLEYSNAALKRGHRPVGNLTVVILRIGYLIGCVRNP